MLIILRARDAEQALKDMDGRVVCGRRITVEFAEKRGRREDDSRERSPRREDDDSKSPCCCGGRRSHVYVGRNHRDRSLNNSGRDRDCSWNNRDRDRSWKDRDRDRNHNDRSDHSYSDHEEKISKRRKRTKSNERHKDFLK